MMRMENALLVWFQDCRQKKISLDTKMSCAEVKALYDVMVPEGGGSGDNEDDPRPGTSSQTSPQPHGFVASKGWFDRFKKRFGLQSESLYGEAAFADESNIKALCRECVSQKY